MLELEGEASVSSPGSAMSAESVTYEPDSGRIQALGDVAGFLEPSGTEGEPAQAGLFESQRPVFFAAGAVSTDPERHAVEFGRGARLWQGRNRIDAHSVSIGQPGGGLRAEGDVRVSWADPGSPEAATDGVSTVKSSQMDYESESGVARFAGDVEFRRMGMAVLSDELRTGLGSGAGEEGRTVVATGSVRIVGLAAARGNRGSGERAEFGLADSTVSLQGRPAWVQAADGTRSQGATLTYRATGDRLQVVGHGAERAYTRRPVPP